MKLKGETSKEEGFFFFVQKPISVRFWKAALVHIASCYS